MQNLNVGLIGGGFMGKAHSLAYAAMPMFYWPAPALPVRSILAESSDALAADAARRFGFERATGDWRKVIDDPDVHVVDIARAHLVGLTQIDRLGFECFNVAGESGRTVREVITAVEAITGRRVAAVPKPRRLGDPAVLIASAAKLRRTLGWQPQQSSLESIVRSAWDWRLRFPRGYGRAAA